MTRLHVGVPWVAPYHQHHVACAQTKIYCMEVHPLQPFNVILGTNVGLFVLHIDATASMSAVAVSHPLWTQSWLTASTVEPTPGSKAGPGSDDEAEPPANVPDTPDVGAREDLVTIYTDATSLRAMTVVPGGSGNAASPTIANRNSGAGAGAGAGAAVDDGASSNRDEVSISVASDEQVCTISPAMSALQAAGASGKVAGAKSTAHAMHHASSSRSRMSGDAAKVGATGSPLWGPAELSVSGSGRHVGVVWPAIRSYAVFRVGGRADGEAGLDAKEVDSGNGVALAWTCAGEFGGNRFDRFVVMEPEFLASIAGSGGACGGWLWLCACLWLCVCACVCVCAYWYLHQLSSLTLCLATAEGSGVTHKAQRGSTPTPAASDPRLPRLAPNRRRCGVQGAARGADAASPCVGVWRPTAGRCAVRQRRRRPPRAWKRRWWLAGAAVLHVGSRGRGGKVELTPPQARQQQQQQNRG